LELAAKEAAASLSVHKFAKDPKEKTGNGPVDSFSQASQNSQNDGIEDIDRVIRPTFLHLTDVHDINVTFAWGSKPLKIRELSSEHVSRLVNISGYVNLFILTMKYCHQCI
jgi:DNA replicative helicase MCM subunit Mcm2 (Cdc46/Mcm family)